MEKAKPITYREFFGTRLLATMAKQQYSCSNEQLSRFRQLVKNQEVIKLLMAKFGLKLIPDENT